MTVGPVVGHARVNTNMTFDSSSLDKIGDRIRNQLSKIGERNGRIYRNFGRDAVASWRLALGSIVTSAPWISAAIGAVSASVTMLGGSLYSLTQTGFALYPVLGSIGVAAGTLAVGMRGFSDAVKATTAEDLKMYLDNLTPSAAASAMAVRGLQEAATRLRKSVQERMFDGLAGEIEKLSTTLFPVLERNLTDMAGVWNKLLKAMLGYINSAGGLNTINQFLEASTSIFDKMSDAVVPFLDGAMKLFIALAPAGERLATRITGVAESFQSWTSAEGFGNRIDSMMKRAETTGGLLLQVVGKLGRALSNIFKAANGPTNEFLQMLIDMFDRFNAWSSSVEGSKAIETWATDSNRVLVQIGRTIESVFKVLQELSSADALISFLQTVEEAFDLLGRLPLDKMVEKFVEIAELFRPISGPILAFIIAGASLNIMIGNIMGQIGGLVAILASFPGKFTAFTTALKGGTTGGQAFLGIFKKIGGFLAKGFKVAGIAGLVVWIGSIIAKSDELKAKLGNVWNAVKEVFSSLWEAFEKIYTSLQPVFTALKPVFDLLEKLAGLAIGAVLDSIVFGIESIARVITGLGDFISGFVDILVGLFTWDTTKMLDGWNATNTGIRDILAGLGGVIATFLSFFAPAKFLGWAFQAFKGLANGISKAMPGVLTGAGNVVTGVLNWIKQLPGKILDFGNRAIIDLGNAFRKGAGGVGDTARIVFDIIITWFKRLPGRLLDFGRDALSKLGGAISGGASAVGSAAKRIFDTVINALKALPTNLLNLGKDALAKMASSISGAVGSVKGAAGKIFDAVKGAVSKLPGEMLNIGKKVIGNIVDGIRNGIGRVKSAAGDVARAIRNFFPGSPVNEGPLTAWNTGGSAEGGGRNIVEAISGGLSNIQPIRKAMNDVADAVRFSMTPSIGSRGRIGSNAAVVAGSSMTIGTLNINLDVEDFESVPRIVNTLEGLAMKVRQGVRVGG